MTQEIENFALPARGIYKVREKLEKKEDVFTIESDPLLASLITCLGIQHDLNKKEWDRLSAPLNHKGSWDSQIITYNGEIGLALSSPHVDEFRPDHPDFRFLLHPLSLGKNGKLCRIVFFPHLIAQAYKKMGIELVIAKAWALSSFLAAPTRTSINYLLVNTNEITDGAALLQAQLISKQRIAFQGTHDLADHLLGARGQGLLQNQQIFSEALECFEHHFESTESRTPRIQKLLIYLAGVILDDMAQAIWYDSDNHRRLLNATLNQIEKQSYTLDLKTLHLPMSFHRLIAILRDKVSAHTLDDAFNEFLLSLHAKF